MKTNLLTRLQAIEIAGLGVVDLVCAENCDFTNRVLQTPGVTEFFASLTFESGKKVALITAYYYQDSKDVELAESLDHLKWEVAGYEIYL